MNLQKFSKVFLSTAALTFLIGLALLFPSIKASVYGLGAREKLKFNSFDRVEVCWLGVSPATAELRQILEDYLIDELEGRAGVLLQFSDECLSEDDPFYPVGIAIYDDPGITPGVRGELSGVAAFNPNMGHPTTYSWGGASHRELLDMVLTSRFKNVSEGLKLQAEPLSEAGKLNLLKSIALHEMLHVLGFVHEQNHPDSTCLTQGQGYAPRAHEAVTEYDENSILNYCLTHHYDFELGPLGLTNLDIEGIQKIYFP